MNYTELLKQLASDIKGAIESLIQSAPFDKTFKAKVTEVLPHNKVKVLYSGNTHTVSTSLLLNEGDFVWVCAPCGNYKNLFVVCKS